MTGKEDNVGILATESGVKQIQPCLWGCFVLKGAAHSTGENPPYGMNRGGGETIGMTRGLFPTMFERANTEEAIGLNRSRLRSTRPVNNLIYNLARSEQMVRLKLWPRTAVLEAKAKTGNDRKPSNHEGSDVRKIPTQGAAMEPSTPKTERAPSTQLRKAVLGTALDMNTTQKQLSLNRGARTTKPKTMAGRLRTACAARLLGLVLLLALPAAVQAQFTYTTNNGTITITGYTGSGGAVTIPSTLNGLPVTSIGDGAFQWCGSLTSVTIGTNVTNIGRYAFSNCTSLTNVTIPTSVTSIGSGAFLSCTSLTGVMIPSSVTSIGDYPFSFCYSLAAITAATNNLAYSSVTGVLFNKSQTTLIQYPAGKAGSYTIPNSVTSIGREAFGGCGSLTSITIPNSVISIDDYAFFYCPNLATITVATNNLAYTSVAGVLFNKSQTTLIKYPLGKAGSSYAIPNSVTSIEAESFSCCTNLTNVTIPNSVTSIGYAAFNSCSSLASITIPNSVTSIEAEAFSSCTRLTSVTIPDSVPSIASDAFENCTSLTTATIGTSVTSIGKEAFRLCASLTGVYFQGNAPSLGSDVFGSDNNATVYYLAGITGWGTTFGGRPTALWNPQGLPQVTPSAGPNGNISPNTPQTVNSGGSLSFTASPNTGYLVDHWLVDGSVVQTGGTGYTLSNIHTNHNVQVTFTFTYGPQASWPMLGHDTRHTGQSEYVANAYGELQWDYPITNSSPLAIGADGTLYLTSNDYYLMHGSYFHALNPNGTLKWRYPLSDNVYSTPAIANDGTVYVMAYTCLYAIDPNGTSKWIFCTSMAMSDTYSSPAIGPDGTVYVGSYDNYLYSIRPDGTLKWRYQTGGHVGSPAIGPDGTVYCGSSDGYLYSINPAGTLKWGRLVGGGNLVIGPDGTVYVSALYSLSAINPNGTLKWLYNNGLSYVSCSALGADGTIYVKSEHSLAAINVSGVLKWRYEIADYYLCNKGTEAIAISADGTVYFTSSDGYLYCLNPDGKPKWRTLAGCGLTGPVIGADGTVYIGSDDQHLYAFKLLNKGVIHGYLTDMATAQDVTVNVGIGSTNVQSGLGFFAMPLEPGTYQIVLSATGYQSLIKSNVLVTKGNVINFDILLPTFGPLNLTRDALLPASVGVPYKDRAWVAGGVAPYMFSVAYGSFPAGVSLDTQYGYIDGTPTTPGSYTCGIDVHDQQGVHSEREYTIEVAQPLTIATANLARSTREQAYFQNIDIAGGTSPYTLSLVVGALPTGMSMSTSGRVTGVPTSTGSSFLAISVTDASGRIAIKDFILWIDEPVSVSSNNLNTGITGQAYNQTLQGTGGYGSYTWSIYSGTLPEGVHLNASTGVLSGTPQTPATMPLVVMVGDSVGRQAFKNLTLVVTVPLAFVTTTLPDGAKNETYSEQVRVSGGLAPYQFSYMGLLPTGLSLNQTNGIISGTPTAAGLYNFQITVTDSSLPTAQTVTATLSLRVTSTLTINSAAVLPTARLGQAISPIVLRAVSGISPYHWSLTSGSLPPGISLAATTGQLTGTPTAAGDYTFTIMVTDSRQPAQTATKEFIYHVSRTLTIDSNALPDGDMDVFYSYTLLGSGGMQPYAWRVKTGTLPAGLVLDAVTGTIAGSPTAVASVQVTIAVTDGDTPAQTAEKTLAINIHLKSSKLLVRSLGLGTLTPNYSNAVLEIGQGYTMTATPASGHKFSQWQVTTNWAEPAAVVLTNKLSFIMQSNLTLTAVFLDTNRPAVTVANLVANQRISNSVYTVRGAASDNVGVSNVWYQLNDWGWALAQGTDSWAAPLQLDQRTNTFQVYAEDTAGNHSTTSSVVFVYVKSGALLVRSLGVGTLTPNYSNAVLEIGQGYTMTATPGNGHKFSQWQVTTNWAEPARVVLTNKLSFTMLSDLTLTAVFLDTNRPTATVTNLVTNQRISNSVYTVRGAASDNVGVSNVWYQLNGSGWTLTIGSNPWAAPLQLDQRTNTFQVYAEDTAGNHSTTNLVRFIYVFTAPMTVQISGKGTVNPNYNGKSLEIGNTYSMTASNGMGYAFTNWTDGGAAVVTNKATISFVMRLNLILQANFMDVQKPVLTITSPADKARFSNAVATVHGTVSDNGPLGVLRHQYAGGNWMSTPASSNWSVGLMLASGTNLFRIYAVDAAGNISLTNSRSLVCTLPASALTNVFKIAWLGRTNAGWRLLVSDGMWGTNRVVQGSSNLLDWTAVFTNGSTNAWIEFLDPQGANAPRRFYRVVLP